MKKAFIVAILTGGLLAACTGETKKEETKGTVKTEKKSEVATSKAELDRKAQEAKTLDSLRQVKEHGHAH